MHEQFQPELLNIVAPRNDRRDAVIARLIEYEETRPDAGLHDEQVWTLLFTYGYVAGGNPADLSQLCSALTEGQEREEPRHAWIEMQPIPSRQGVAGLSEGNTELDLSFGDMELRGGISGIRYEQPTARDGWFGTVEAKWLHDIAYKTTYDAERNQLARVIETALTFQHEHRFPGRVHVTLLTPGRFFRPNRDVSGSRLYHYKFYEYKLDDEINEAAILHDIENAEIPIRTAMRDWAYPDLRARVSCLRLHWVTYEILFHGMPASRYKTILEDFIRQEPHPLLEV